MNILPMTNVKYLRFLRVQNALREPKWLLQIILYKIDRFEKDFFHLIRTF